MLTNIQRDWEHHEGWSIFDWVYVVDMSLGSGNDVSSSAWTLFIYEQCTITGHHVVYIIGCCFNSVYYYTFSP